MEKYADGKEYKGRFEQNNRPKDVFQEKIWTYV